jgi:hypothetical protein
MWEHFKHFQSKIFFFLVAFLSQHLNYFVILCAKSLITPAVKILIPFIILGTRPTSTPGPRRDQLVCCKHRVFFSLFIRQLRGSEKKGIIRERKRREKVQQNDEKPAKP